MQLPARKKAVFFVIAVFFTIFLSWSCSDLIDTSDYELEKVRASPDISIPLAFGDLRIEDLLNSTDSSFIQVYPDGLVYLLYEKTLTTRDIRDMLRFPDKNFEKSIPLVPGILPPKANESAYVTLSTTEDFGFAPEKLTEIKFKAGAAIELSVNFTPQDPASGVFEVEIELPDFQLNGIALKKRIPANTAVSIPLTDYIAALDNNRFDLNVTFIEKAHSATVVITDPTSATVAIGFAAIDFQYVRGFFGERAPTRIPTLTIDMNAFGNSLHGAQISFAEPSVKMQITSEYGLPATIDFNPFEVRKKNASALPILFTTSNPVQIFAPANPGGEAVTDLEIANTAEIFDYVPEQFYYQVQMKINDGLTSGTNFCADTSKIKIKLTTEVPIFGKASGIVLTDTFDVDLSEMKESNLESATLHSKAINEMPLDANLQIYLADEAGIIMDSIFSSGQTPIIKGSKVTSGGDLSEAGVATLDLHLSSDKLETLFEAKKIIVKMTMGTSKETNGDQVHVKFKSNYKINLTLGFEARLNLEVDL
jgi:hypothetical protein